MKMPSTTKNDVKVPTVGGFFLSRRQIIRAATIFLALLLSILSANNKVSFSTLQVLKESKWKMHLFAFSCFYGCGMWVSFVSGLVMFNNLPRHIFGKLQSKLFPRYFQYSILWIGVCLAMEVYVLLESYFVKDSASSHLQLPFVQRTNLLVIMGTLIINLKLEPITTKVMFKRHIVERKIGTGNEVGVIKPAQSLLDAADPKDVEQLKLLSKEFGKLHGMSASLNLLALILGTWHTCWIGSIIRFK
mmetsp:Transcript_22395/g.21528  ORF Transcript_22395/g.21528 Transcript_22395/m.21528 type:complete len:246 (-) Transcript_22395:164-901(-)